MYFTEVKPAGIVDRWGGELSGSQTRGRLCSVFYGSLTAEESECS